MPAIVDFTPLVLKTESSTWSSLQAYYVKANLDTCAASFPSFAYTIVCRGTETEVFSLTSSSREEWLHIFAARIS